MSRIKNIFKNIFQTKKKKEKEKLNQPTHWTLGWSLEPELGFDDGTYLPRKAALILYPEYFDEHGEPIFDLLPIGKPKSTT